MIIVSSLQPGDQMTPEQSAEMDKIPESPAVYDGDSPSLTPRERWKIHYAAQRRYAKLHSSQNTKTTPRFPLPLNSEDDAVTRKILDDIAFRQFSQTTGTVPETNAFIYLIKPSMLAAAQKQRFQT